MKNTLFRSLLLSALILMLAHSPVLASKTVVMTAPHWEGQANRDGTGFYWEVFQKVLHLKDIK